MTASYCGRGNPDYQHLDSLVIQCYQVANMEANVNISSRGSFIQDTVYTGEVRVKEQVMVSQPRD